jgi:hypothetical protein
MFPHPECTKMPRTNNNLTNSVDFLRPMISNPSIPIYNNHESYTFDKNSFINNMDIERNMQSSRIDKNNKPIQSNMQSSYQFFNNNMLGNPQVNNDDTYYDLSTFNNHFKVGDEVTLNYVDSKNDEYYIRGNITEIDISNNNIIIHNNNPLFFPRHYEFNSYSMIFLKHGFFTINRIKTSMIKKE